MIRNKKEARKTVIIKGEKVTMAGWRENIRKVTPYVPGEQPKQAGQGRLIKLNTNENPYPPAPEVAECLKKMDTEAFRLYPNTDAAPIVEELAKRFGLPQECFFVGVGSDDVLAAAFQTFFSSTKPVLFPDISYSFYPVWANMYQIPYCEIPVDKDFHIVAKDYYRENGGIIFPNPNAPTSLYMGLDEVENIVKNNQESVVIVDEAYIDFGGQSAISLIDKYENLLVVQTYSKSRSMAGMRIGYAIGSQRLIEAMQAVKFSINSYTMNITSLVYGSAVLEDEEYFQECVEKIIATRERTKRELAELGFTFLDSKTNFLFAQHKKIHADALFEELKKKNIYVRYFNRPKIDNYLRITIGTDEQMNKLFAALKEIINEG